MIDLLCIGSISGGLGGYLSEHLAQHQQMTSAQVYDQLKSTAQYQANQNTLAALNAFRPKPATSKCAYCRSSIKAMPCPNCGASEVI